MRWIKHMTHAHDDGKLSLILDRFGPEGYGLYWLLIELIATNFNEKQRTFLRFSKKKWSNDCQISLKKFQKIINFMENPKNFIDANPLIFTENSENQLTINIPNIKKYKDEWTRNKIKNSGETQEQLRSNSGVTPLQTETETEAYTEKADSRYDGVIAAAYEELLAEKMDHSAAKFLSEHYEPNLILEKIKHFRYLKNSGKKFRRSEGGYLRKSIEENYSVPKGFQDFINNLKEQERQLNFQKQWESLSSGEKEQVEKQIITKIKERRDWLTDHFVFWHGDKSLQEICMDADHVNNAVIKIRNEILGNFEKGARSYKK